MPDAPTTPAAVPAAAPAAPTTPVQTSTPPAGAGASPAAKASPEDAASAWGDKDKAALFDLLKRSPYRFKANGEEKGLDDEDALRGILNDASRGRGASKVVEEAKKTRAEAERLRGEAQRHLELVEKARRGDYQARLELGLVAADEKAQREAELAQVPPEVRQLMELAEKQAAEIEEMRAASEQAQKEAEAQRTEAQRAQLLKTASSYLQKVLDASGLDLQADAAEARPWMAAVLQAMREFDKAGLDVAQDTTVEQLVARARELREEASERSFGRLKAEKRLALARGDLEALAGRFTAAEPTATADEVLAAVGPKVAYAVAKAVAQREKAKRMQPPTSTPAPKVEADEDERPRGLAFGGNPNFMRQG